MSFHSEIRARLLVDLQAAGLDEAAQLNNGLRLLGKWRSALIQNTFLQQQGTRVLGGPLAGMDFLAASAEGCHVPKLLGCYEQPLQPAVEAAMRGDYEVVLNIGCAEGYYAVGMARRMPGARILAFDINPRAKAVCGELARKNGVEGRIEIHGLFKPRDFAAYAAKRVLVMCDIEGAERDLLDPASAPALCGMDLIVESHECLSAGITQLLIQRFSPTHEVTVVEDDGQRRLDDAPAWFKNLSHLDQLLAVWEWRSGPTPWLVMRARKAKA